jgi:hypothetical protein
LKKRLVAFVALILLLGLPMTGRVHALGGSTLTAPNGSNVIIDGSLGPSEWSDGTHLSFNWASNNASLNGGGNVWVKTNQTNLLVAVGADGPTTRNAGADTYNYTLSLLFDNNNNGVVNNYEDAKSDSFTFPAAGGQVESYHDLHYDSTQQGYVQDVYSNGTASGSHSPSNAWVWEFSIPLSSNYAEDFTLAQNASIGFEVVFTAQHYNGLSLVSSGWAYWEAAYSTGFPSGVAPSADPWVVIIWTNLQAPISDTTPPTISTPAIRPASPSSADKVTVLVNVTDAGSGVKNVSVTFTTDNWKNANTTILGSYNITSGVAEAQIPAQQFGGHIEYYVVAFDNAGNRAINNNSGSYFAYDVTAPFYLSPWFYALLAAIIVAIAALIIFSRRKRKPSTQS